MHPHEANQTQLRAELMQRRAHQQRSIAGDQLDIVAGSLDVLDVARPHREHAVTRRDVEDALDLRLSQALCW